MDIWLQRQWARDPTLSELQFATCRCRYEYLYQSRPTSGWHIERGIKMREKGGSPANSIWGKLSWNTTEHMLSSSNALNLQMMNSITNNTMSLRYHHEGINSSVHGRITHRTLTSNPFAECSKQKRCGRVQFSGSHHAEGNSPIVGTINQVCCGNLIDSSYDKSIEMLHIWLNVYGNCKISIVSTRGVYISCQWWLPTRQFRFDKFARFGLHNIHVYLNVRHIFELSL